MDFTSFITSPKIFFEFKKKLNYEGLKAEILMRPYINMMIMIEQSCRLLKLPRNSRKRLLKN